MKKAKYIKFLVVVIMFLSLKSFSQIYVETPELLQTDFINDSISKLYSIEYNSTDSNHVVISIVYPSGLIRSKWNYTSLSDSILAK